MVSREEYLSTAPFPHAVMGGLFPQSLIDEAEKEFPSWGHPTWAVFGNAREVKAISNDSASMGLATRSLIHLLCCEEMIASLEAMTGIAGLIPDLHGGGMHLVPQGGKLGIHTDFNRGHNGYRRLNGLLFLNSSWDEAWGGDLELWSKDKSKKVKIAPTSNRFVIFTTSDESFHGHPNPLECPPGRSRKSLAVYYFTKEPPADVAAPHSTVFLEG